ncbi:MAG: hypothetical protein ACPF9D_07915, partial [Owenweeksia sp.]
MRALVLAGMLLLKFTCSYAQSVPGYMGKRISVVYDGFFFPSFINTNSREPNYSSEGYSLQTAGSEGISLNYQHHLNISYAFTKKIGLGLDLGYLSTSFNPASDIYFDGNYIAAINFDQNPAVSAITVAASMRSFTSHFAPLGSYWEYKLGVILTSVSQFDYVATRDS